MRTKQQKVSQTKFGGYHISVCAKCSPYSIVIVSNLLVVKVGYDVVGVVTNSF